MASGLALLDPAPNTAIAFNAAPGTVAPVGTGTTIVGPGGAAPEVCVRVARLLSEAGIAASVAYDIRPHLWGKLIANAAINPVAALLDRPNGVVLTDANAGDLARSLAYEAAAVAGAIRVALPFDDPWSYVRSIVEQTAELRNTMLTDLRARAKTENDHISGAVAGGA